MDLTPEEEKAVGRKMLEAALEQLGKLPETPDDQEEGDIAKRVVRAVCAAEDVCKREIARLSAAKGGDVWVGLFASRVVATAFWFWSEGHDWLGLDEVNAESWIGQRFLSFAQGMAAARAMSEAQIMLSDDGPFDFVGDGARALAGKLD